MRNLRRILIFSATLFAAVILISSLFASPSDSFSNTCHVCPDGSTCQRDYVCNEGKCEWGFRCIQDVTANGTKSFGEVCESSGECSAGLSCRSVLSNRNNCPRDAEGKPSNECLGEPQRICVRLLPTLAMTSSPSCACEKVNEPVCASDGRVFGNACLAKCADAELKNEGRCRQSLAVESNAQTE